MKSLRILLLSVLLCCSAYGTAVRGTLLDGSGHPMVSGTLQFTLQGCGNNPPNLIGNVGTLDNLVKLAHAGAGGVLIDNIVGNDQIVCGGLASTTYWQVAAYPGAVTGTPTWTANYVITGGLWNVNTAVASNVVPPTALAFSIIANPGPGVSQTITQQAGTSLSIVGVFNANLTGNASTSSALDHTPTLCSTGTVPSGITALGAAVCASSLSLTGQYLSTLATGTAPLVINSTTPVAKLSLSGGAGTSIAGFPTISGTAGAFNSLAVAQAVNGTDFITGQRITNTLPAGNFLHFTDPVNFDLFTVDITGTLTVGVVPAPRINGHITESQSAITSVFTDTNNTWTTGIQDMTGATATLPIKAGTSAAAPLTCVANKELYIKTDAVAGFQLTLCNNTGNGYVAVGGGSFANINLSNLASVAINLGLTPGTNNLSVGTATNPWKNLFIAGTAGTSAFPASASFQITGTPTAARVITLPDNNTTLAGISIPNSFTSIQTLSAASSTDMLDLINSTAATSGVNQNSPQVLYRANIWSGAISTAENWLTYVIAGTGTNPTSYFAISPQGASTGRHAVVGGLPSSIVTDLGALDRPWADIYLQGTVTNANYFKLTGTPTGARVITLPNATTTLAGLSVGNTFSTAQTIAYNSLTPSTALSIANGSIATFVANYAGMGITFSGNYWDTGFGGVSLGDTWSLAHNLGSGSNPVSSLDFTHFGSLGATAITAANASLGTTAAPFSNVIASSDTVLGTNGAQVIRGFNSELITLSTSGLTTQSSANLLPNNSIIDSVVIRVVTTITTTTNFSVGDATTTGRFIAANANLSSGSTAVGLVHIDQTGAAGPRQTSAAKIQITCTGSNPGAGQIRVTVFYRQFVAPTS